MYGYLGSCTSCTYGGRVRVRSRPSRRLISGLHCLPGDDLQGGSRHTFWDRGLPFVSDTCQHFTRQNVHVSNLSASTAIRSGLSLDAARVRSNGYTSRLSVHMDANMNPTWLLPPFLLLSTFHALCRPILPTLHSAPPLLPGRRQ